MKRIRLDEENFKELVNEGNLLIDDTNLSFAEMCSNGNLEKMCLGEMIEQSEAQIILADIGFDRIDNILKGL